MADLPEELENRKMRSSVERKFLPKLVGVSEQMSRLRRA
jgi:hypothetical protein